MKDRIEFLNTLRLIRKQCFRPSGITTFSELLLNQEEETKKCRKNIQGGKNADSLEAILRENAEPLHLKVHSCCSPEEAAQTITAIAIADSPEFTQETALVLHDHPEIHRLKLPQQLAESHIPCLFTVKEAPDLRQKTLDSSIGVTVADWGAADCAAIVQLTAPGRPRSTSLVPSMHIALLRKNNLLGSMEEVYERLGGRALPNSFVFISGPSKTADIEAHMVLGAHGPREMHLVLVD